MVFIYNILPSLKSYSYTYSQGERRTNSKAHLPYLFQTLRKPLWLPRKSRFQTPEDRWV